MSRDNSAEESVSSGSESSSHPGEEHGKIHNDDTPEHEQWDFLPVHPPLADERPDSYPESATDEAAYQSYYESICGGNDESRPVELYDGEFRGVTTEFVEEHEGAVGQLQWQKDLGDLDVVHDDPNRYAGERWCSGTLIDDDLLLTAGHCFMIQNMPRPSAVARHMQVNFNYQADPDGELRETESYDIVELVEHEFEYGGLDYAIVRLEGTPGERFGTATIAETDAEVDDTLCLISHPNQMPKRIEAGHVTHRHDVRMGYEDLDTADGSSGAGILASPSGTLVGVHTMGGCDAIRSSHNHGVRIEALLEASDVLAEVAGVTITPTQGPTSGTSVDQQTQVAQTGETHHDEPHRDEPGEYHAKPESHLSTLESHLSTLESHLSTLESDQSTLESHLSTLESHESMLGILQKLIEVQEQTLAASTTNLEECLHALEECSDEIQRVANKQDKTKGNQ